MGRTPIKMAKNQAITAVAIRSISGEGEDVRRNGKALNV